jgi:hypothetical protein
LAWLFEVYLAQGSKMGALAALRAMIETAKRVFGPGALAGSGTGAYPGSGGEEKGAQHAATEALTKHVAALEARLAAGETVAANITATADKEPAGGAALTKRVAAL